MVSLPTIVRCLKLADEILTDSFVTETEPLMLNASWTEAQKRSVLGITPRGETVNGNHTLRAFSLCHHKSTARVITLHMLLNCFLEEPQLCFRHQQTHKGITLLWKLGDHPSGVIPRGGKVRVS